MFSNNSENIVLGELGSNSSLRFLGPNHGVLPIGPHSIPGLDTLQHLPLLDAGTNSAILSYNYTLNHQGLTSNISCIYDTQSLITYSAAPKDLLGSVTGSCNKTVLDNPLPPNYQILNTDRTLASWWCCYYQDQVCYIYLRGSGQIYDREIGNISCSVSQIQPALFTVTYQSSTNVFSTQEQVPHPATPSMLFSHHTYWATQALTYLVHMAQNAVNNQIAESVKDLGIQALWLQPPNDQYLPLYEAMIQGMLMDMVCTANNSSLPLLMANPQLTYTWFQYSMQLLDMPTASSSCFHTVNGTMSAEVTGWVARPIHIAFLMPMTILNLASLILALVSIVKAKRSSHECDPTDPRSLILAESRLNEGEPSGWSDGVSYHLREVRESGAER